MMGGAFVDLPLPPGELTDFSTPNHRCLIAFAAVNAGRPS
jgi:hypothetical protein